MAHLTVYVDTSGDWYKAEFERITEKEWDLILGALGAGQQTSCIQPDGKALGSLKATFPDLQSLKDCIATVQDNMGIANDDYTTFHQDCSLTGYNTAISTINRELNGLLKRNGEQIKAKGNARSDRPPDKGWDR